VAVDGRRLLVGFLVGVGFDDIDHRQRDIPERAADLAFGDAGGVFDAVGVEDIDFEQQADQRGFGRDKRRIERLAAGRTARDADFDVDVLLVLLVEPLPAELTATPIASSTSSTSRTNHAASIATR